jgi:hypothetical protein
MKKFLFVITVLLCSLIAENTIAVCQIAHKENTVECHEDARDVCCLVKEVNYDEVCYSSFCYERDKCEWEVLLPRQCIRP